jgi:hypothetical protein
MNKHSPYLLIWHIYLPDIALYFIIANIFHLQKIEHNPNMLLLSLKKNKLERFKGVFSQPSS